MAPSLVQYAWATGASGTTLTVTLGGTNSGGPSPGATTTGNCLVVCAGTSQGTTNPVISGITLGGSAGNFAVVKAINNNSDTDCEIWADPNCAGGQTSVVVSFTGGTGGSLGMCAWVMEWSGIATTSPADKTNGQSSAGAFSSWSSLSSGTLSQASEVVFGAVCGDVTGGTITGPGSPWTNLAQLNSTPAGLLAGYQIVSATTAQTYSGSFGATAVYVAVTGTLKAATATPVAEADAGAAADLIAAQATSIPPAIIRAPPRPAGPPPPPVRAQILTVPQGSAAPADTAAAAETMTAGTVTVPLADVAGAADTISGGVFPADQAGAADTLAVTAVTATLADLAGAAEALTAAVQLSAYDTAAAADLSQTAGLTQPDTAAAADTLTAAVAVHVTDKAAALDTYGTEPAIGASGGATIPRAAPGTSQVAVAAPGTNRWYYLGSYGTMTALTYSYTCPGGCDSMTCTLMVPASYRNQIMNPGWQVRITRGGHTVWTGKMDEPIPTAQGWNFTAIGTGMRGTDFLAIYTDTWPTNQPDESINNAISRGLPWVNPGVGSPSGIWLGQGVDSAASSITALLNLATSRGGLTWYVNSQPGGMPGDDLSVFPLPTVPNRLLVATTPVPRTLGGDLNTVYLRYQITADNTSSSSSSTAPATYGLAIAQNAQSVAMHGTIETFIDISDVGVLSQAAAQAVGNNVLQIYQRASFAGPFTGSYGQLLNMGGTPIDPATDQAGTVVRAILTDFGAGGELTPGPIQFIVGAYSWNDFAGTFTITPYQNLDTSLTGLLQMENTVLTPITVASG